MRSKKSYVFWTIFNCAFLAWDVFWGTTSLLQGEFGWALFYFVCGAVMAVCQYYNGVFTSAGLTGGRTTGTTGNKGEQESWLRKARNQNRNANLSRKRL